MAVGPDRRFGRSSHVLRYWLLRCEGFTVLSRTGRRLGVVERVSSEATSRHASVLEVRRRWPLPRRRLISADAVEQVAPWEEAIVLSATAARKRRRAPWRRIARAGLRAGTEGVRVGRRAAAETLRASEPHARHAARTAAALAAWAADCTVRVGRAGLAYAVRACRTALRTARTHGPPAARTVAHAARIALASGAALSAGAARKAHRLALEALRTFRDWRRRQTIQRRAADWFESLPRRH